jgi:hypothetical protein
MQNYNLAFSYADGGKGNIFHPLPDSEMYAEDNLECVQKIAHLLWKIMEYKIEVSRPFTFATLLMILGEIPKSKDLSIGVDGKLQRDLEKDLKVGWPTKWNALNLLRASFSEVKVLVKLYGTVDYAEEFGATFTGLQLEEGMWREQVELRISTLTWHYLFGTREVVSKALQSGFRLATEELQGVADPVMLQKISEGSQLITAEMLRLVCSGASGVEASTLLDMMHFSSSISQVSKELFIIVVHDMSYTKRSYLLAFITGQEFLGGREKIKVVCKDEDDKRCPKSQVFFNTLALPPYKDLKTMKNKVLLAIGCGRASFGIV